MTTCPTPLPPATLIGTQGIQSCRVWFLGIAFVGLLWSAPAASAAAYEVWVSDQANTQGIMIYL